eukprot:TRINITY_DN10794_c0_g1_i1.p1 TRINITY_DN10794_c0_g1~~TRINITY_DN10794_c0_g1_i1.p1  ORF type:complete len:152 (-),score=13.42 TRINITY_DN10794_c0_g1_i1:190-645(-)
MDESAPLVPGIFPGIRENTALIGIAQKGFVSLEIAINGVGGHSSQPGEESNIVALAKAVEKVEAAQFPYKIHDAVRYQYRYMGPELPEAQQPLYKAVAYGENDTVTDLEKKFIDVMSKMRLLAPCFIPQRQLLCLMLVLKTTYYRQQQLQL